jgi:hypothetical protein
MFALALPYLTSLATLGLNRLAPKPLLSGRLIRMAQKL